MNTVAVKFRYMKLFWLYFFCFCVYFFPIFIVAYLPIIYQFELPWFKQFLAELWKKWLSYLLTRCMETQLTFVWVLVFWFLVKVLFTFSQSVNLYSKQYPHTYISTDEKTLYRFSLQYAKLRMIQHFFCEMLTTCYQVTHPLFT